MIFFRKKKKHPFAQQQAEASADGSGNSDDSLTRGVMIAYGILLFHVALLGGILVLMFVFGGFVHYFLWILLGGVAAVAGGAYLFIRKLKDQQHVIRKLLQLPEFRNRNVEISLLGGAASFRLGGHSDDPETEMKRVDGSARPLLEDTAGTRIKNLGELGRLYEQSMITAEEYEALKKELLKSLQGGTGNDTNDDDIVEVLGVTGSTKAYYNK